MNKVIAIDGTSASGKGTLARKLAEALGLPYLNTGGLYRAVALFLYRNNLDYNDPKVVLANMAKADFSDLENPELHNETVGAITSKIAAIPELRKFLFDIQVDFSRQDGGAVLDGRDIGTVICPKARYKFFVIADAEVRAMRRYKEMLEKGVDADYNDILEKIKQRDKNDFERAVAPLRKADDAVEVDTTHLNPKEVLDYVLGFIDMQKVSK
jgi:cytidylate kinase